MGEIARHIDKRNEHHFSGLAADLTIIFEQSRNNITLKSTVNSKLMSSYSYN